MVSAKSDVLSLWNIIAVCCKCLLASAMELERCLKFPPAQIALASFFVTCVSAPSRKKLPKRRKTRLSVRRKLFTCSLANLFLRFFSVSGRHAFTIVSEYDWLTNFTNRTVSRPPRKQDKPQDVA